MRMKQRLLSFLTLAVFSTLLLALPIPLRAGTITLTAETFGLSNYKSYSYTENGFSFTINKAMKSSEGYIQMNTNQSSYILYNTTAIPGLKSITVEVGKGSNSYTITTGTSERPSSNAVTVESTHTFSVDDPSAEYFQLKLVKGACYFSSIVIEYETAAPTQLEVPTNLQAIDITATNATLSWDAVANATKYQVRWWGVNDGEYYNTDETTETSYALTGLHPNIYYTWTVQALGDGTRYTDSERTAEEGFTTTEFQQLPAPTGLQVTDLQPTTATLSWEAVPNASGYTVYYMGENDTEFTDSHIQETTYTFTGLTPETYYLCYVIAEGDNKQYSNSPQSEDLDFTTPALQQLPTPTNVRTFNEKPHSVVFLWDDVEHAVGYTITYKELATGTTQTINVQESYSYTLENLKENTAYSWTIIARGNQTTHSDSEPSETIIFSTTTRQQLLAPTNLHTISVEPNSATLSWDPVDAAITYRVYYKKANAQSFTQYRGIIPEWTVTLTGLQNNTTYIYKVIAVADGEVYTNSPESEQKEFTTPDYPRYTLTFVDRGTTNIAADYIAGESVSRPDDPTGVCTTPTEYIFHGWATSEVTSGSTSCTLVTFPYSMPAANTTLYAVYRYPTNNGGATETTWTLITDLSQITEGTYALLANGDVAFNGTMNSKNIGQSTSGSFDFNADGIATSAPTGTRELQFISSGNGFKMYDPIEDKYLYANDAQKENLYYQKEETSYWYATSESWVYALNNAHLRVYSNTFRTYGSKNNDPLRVARKNEAAVLYTSSPLCGPFVQITQGSELYVTAGNAGGTRSTVTLRDTVFFTAGRLAAGPSGKMPEVRLAPADISSADLSATVVPTATTQNEDGTYNIDGYVLFDYKPATYDTREDIAFSLSATYNDDADRTAAAGIVHARSLPEHFVIVAQYDGQWYALNGDMTGSNAQPANTHVEVDNTSAPTRATIAPSNSLYTFDGVPRGGDLRYTRFVGTTGKYLWAAKDGNTGVQNYAANTPEADNQSYNWLLTSADNETYTLANAQNTRLLRLYSSTAGIRFGMYANGTAELRILPIDATCAYDYAPTDLTASQVTATTALLSWTAVPGATAYQLSPDGTAWTTTTETTYTLTGLTPETHYSIRVRARHDDRPDDQVCADEATCEFTTSLCDDVPYDLHATVTASSATITWKSVSSTASVVLYSDEECTAEVARQDNAASPCLLADLAPNTLYYYKVYADGTCESLAASFTTESNEISVVEWQKDAIIVDINTDGDGASVVVESKASHGSADSNIADDIFFSKYFEANSNVKLLAIYNGTKKTYDLSEYQIWISRAARDSINGMATWTYMDFNDFLVGDELTLQPNEERIVYSYQDRNKTDADILSCAKNNPNSGMDEAVRIGDCLEFDCLDFSGNDAIALVKTSTGDFIDLIGAGTETEADLYKCIKKKDFMDAAGWYITDGTSIEDGSTIALSTNRCLLVRKNHVRSGHDAVAQNTTDFTTFAAEWSGKQVVATADNTLTESSCEAFDYVGAFDYNNYYTTYEKVTETEITGKRNADGTYTIPVDRLDTLACQDIRLQVTKDGAVVAAHEQRVPIIITQSTTTADQLFYTDKLGADVCSTCDVVVRDGAQLTHAQGGIPAFNDMQIYAGSRLEIPENQSLTLQRVQMYALGDDVSYALINNGSDASDAITVHAVVHIKRIDGRYWYPFSLPYDCRIADIVDQAGKSLGVYGTDWGIKYYDGERRQSDGNSTTRPGEVSQYWTMMPADATLQAHTGYIIGLFVPTSDEALMRSVAFTPATAGTYTESAASKTTTVQAWATNLTADARHHGWNFVGSPYISRFGTAEGEGLYNNSLSMGWTNSQGEQQDKEHVYISIPDGGNSNTYTQSLASATAILPFTAYFVQAVDPTSGADETITLTYSKTLRELPADAPRRIAADDGEQPSTLLAELTLTNADGSLRDNAGILVNNCYSASYEIGDDLMKLYAAERRPQLFTLDAQGEKMAYQALPDHLAHAIPLGIYVPEAGEYTLALNRYASRLTDAESIYLLAPATADAGATGGQTALANLLTDSYLLTLDKGLNTGYALDIRRAPKTPTGLTETGADAPYLHYHEGLLTIGRLPEGAVVGVYDVLGRLLRRHVCPAAGEQTLRLGQGIEGTVLTVVVATEQQQYVLKTLIH